MNLERCDVSCHTRLCGKLDCAWCDSGLRRFPAVRALMSSRKQSFLNSVVQHFRKTRADVIIPPTNNTLFRTYPDGAEPSSVR